MDLHYIKISWSRQSSPSGFISEQENVCITPGSCWFSGSYIKFKQGAPNGHRHSLFNISSKEVSYLSSLPFLASISVRIKRIMSTVTKPKLATGNSTMHRTVTLSKIICHSFIFEIVTYQLPSSLFVLQTLSCTPLFFFQIYGLSFFFNCWFMYTCIYILKQNLLYLYNVTPMYDFKAGHWYWITN